VIGTCVVATCGETTHCAGEATAVQSSDSDDLLKTVFLGDIMSSTRILELRFLARSVEGAEQRTVSLSEPSIMLLSACSSSSSSNKHALCGSKQDHSSASGASPQIGPPHRAGGLGKRLAAEGSDL